MTSKRQRLGAYTDLTMLCPSCRLRVPARFNECPRCAGKLQILKSADLARFDAWGPHRRRRRRTVLAFVVSLASWGIGAIVYAYATASNNPIVGFWFVFVARALLCLVPALPLAAMTGWIWSRLRRRAWDGLEALGVEATPQMGKPAVVGRVGCATGEWLVEPLTGARCVAYRLEGRAGRHDVNDGAAASFSVIGLGGDTVLIEAERAIVFAEIGSEHGARSPAPELVPFLSFLSERGIFEPSSPLRLSVGTLREGDSVEVWGAVEQARIDAETIGLRETRLTTVVCDTADTPLVIRRTTAPR